MSTFAAWFGVNAIVAAVAFALGWHVHKARQERRQDPTGWLDGYREPPPEQESAERRQRPPEDPYADGWPGRRGRSTPDRQTAALTLPAFTQTLPTAAVAGRPPWEAARRPRRPYRPPAAVTPPPAPPPPAGPTPIELEALAAVQARQDVTPEPPPPPGDDGDDIGPVTAANLLTAETVSFLQRLRLDDQLYRSSVGLPAAPANGVSWG